MQFDCVYIFVQNYELERAQLISNLKSIETSTFESAALDLFRYQYINNSVYQHWVDALNVNVDAVSSLEDIPYLPISAFKNHNVISLTSYPTHVFRSSGTTGSISSRHLVFDMKLYLENAQKIFREYYGSVKDYCFLALLPNYLEKGDSSLVAMVEHFIGLSQYSESGFYLYDHDKLEYQLSHCQKNGIPVVLFGVSFALLDFLADRNIRFPELIVIETGGMKGRKKEMTKSQLQKLLASGFGVERVHSEYGMTELFSQAYSKQGGIFNCGRSMKVVIRDITDPLADAPLGKSGLINIIDLANVDSCAFIETQDLGRVFEDGSFEVLGRIDAADIRGCNLMVSDL